jgi:hypothetical protein
MTTVTNKIAHTHSQTDTHRQQVRDTLGPQSVSVHDRALARDIA